jgi:hypothetical protein
MWCSGVLPGGRGVTGCLGGEEVGPHRLKGARRLFETRSVARGEAARMSRSSCREFSFNSTSELLQVWSRRLRRSEAGQTVERSGCADEVTDVFPHLCGFLELAMSGSNLAPRHGNPGARLEKIHTHEVVGRKIEGVEFG